MCLLSSNVHTNLSRSYGQRGFYTSIFPWLNNLYTDHPNSWINTNTKKPLAKVSLEFNVRDVLSSTTPSCCLSLTRVCTDIQSINFAKWAVEHTTCSPTGVVFVVVVVVLCMFCRDWQRSRCSPDSHNHCWAVCSFVFALFYLGCMKYFVGGI